MTMKNIFLNMQLWVIGMAMMAVACDNEPEVGTLLHNNKGNTQTSASIQSLYADNYVIWNGYLTPGGLVAPEDTLSFYVHLNGPMDKSVTFTVAADSDEADAYNTLNNKNFTVMDTAFVKVLNPQVTIAAGDIKSAEPVRVVVNDKSKLNAVTSQGFLALNLQTTDTTVALADKHLVYLQVNKHATNIKKNGSLAEETMIPYTEFDMAATANNATIGRLKDGLIGMVNTWTTSIYTWGTKPTIVCGFQQAREIKGFRWIPQNYYNTYGNNIQSLEVMTRESDTADWVSQGVFQLGVEPSNQDPIDVQFVMPVTAKYVRINLLKGFKTLVGISELSLY